MKGSWMGRRFRAGMLVATLLLLPFATRGQSPAAWPPEHLRDTGLYEDWDTRTVSPDNLPFSPQYPLWTDGAAKLRWIRLPAGAWIDASDPDAWEFPVGTRLWKEFRFARRAETRLIEHTPLGWQYASYAWNEDETDAVLAPDRGISRSVEIRNGVRHAIPSRTDCRACHEGGPTRVLGFSALQLSPDRDPNAPHAEPLPVGAVDLRTLVERGLVRGLPARFLDPPPRIQASSATARAALGYLHGNCSSCHSAAGELANLDFSLQYPLAGAASDGPPAVLTALERPAKFRPASSTVPAERLCSGGPDLSLVVTRMSSRHPLMQMPPLGTRLVDEEAVGLIRRWIAEDLGFRTTTTRLAEENR
jgi:mono/diheme cytochrome c family protein